MKLLISRSLTAIAGTCVNIVYPNIRVGPTFAHWYAALLAKNMKPVAFIHYFHVPCIEARDVRRKFLKRGGA